MQTRAASKRKFVSENSPDQGSTNSFHCVEKERGEGRKFFPSFPVSLTKSQRGTSQKNLFTTTIDKLPNVVLSSIFQYLSFEDLSQHRRVCKAFQGQMEELLNRGFDKTRKFADDLYDRFRKMLPRRPSKKKHHPFYDLSSVTENISTIIRMLGYSFKEPIRKGHCCFFAGKVLDLILLELNCIEGELNRNVPRRIAYTFSYLENLRDYESMAIDHLKHYAKKRHNVFLPVLPESKAKLMVTCKNTKEASVQTTDSGLSEKMLKKQISKHYKPFLLHVKSRYLFGRTK
uniref:F-box domain-containing protein n=1 Tax=Ditylenchus dipsaci TaxID=166011 RepID=A0A915E5Z8_9BILA